jgi:CRISPR-associated protein Cas2
MSESRSTWVIAYDVVDDDRRAKLARYFESQGHRVQYSVFELLATRDEMDAVLARALEDERFDPKQDSLRVYSLCANCAPQAKVFGLSLPVLAEGRPLVL